MPNFRLTLEYDGTDFRGWQVQAGGERTVQGALEAAVERLTGSAVRVHGAGRTDSGVHAEGQVASVALETPPSIGDDAAAFQRALNGCLPPDVAVVDASVAAPDFHARFSARGKHYRYALWNSPVRAPLRARRTALVPQLLDLAAMRSAAAALRGRRDFASFQASGSHVESTVRTLTRLDVEGAPGAEIRFEVAADGFLRHMVRALVGTLVEVGRGRRPADSLAQVLAARDRAAAGPTAPARGLTLVRVDY